MEHSATKAAPMGEYDVAAFQEQARRGLDDRFPRCAARNLRDHPVRIFSKLHPKILFALISAV